MTKYYLDTEFNGFGGELLSIALVEEGNVSSFYATLKQPEGYEEWVRDNVVPILYSVPEKIWIFRELKKIQITAILQEYLKPNAHIIADWPDDIRYFCDLLITAPGGMINIPRISFEVVKIDAYPTILSGAVRHNAWWDAQALRVALE
ncbi:MAG: hypothetical protein EBU08_19680 [Micrococcales bacterium]|nr:hypothetical protein [Micrococcales bacterium]